MNNKVTDRMIHEAEFFKALAHPSRIYIIRALLEKDCCVMELTEALGVEMPTVSRHLSVLKSNSIIGCTKVKNQNYYFLKCHCIFDLFNCVSNLETK